MPTVRIGVGPIVTPRSHLHDGLIPRMGDGDVADAGDTGCVSRAEQPTVVAAVLGGCALAEAIVRVALTDGRAQLDIALCLLALSTTLPLAGLKPLGAAATIAAATFVSVVLFHTLTVAGAIALIAALHQLGRTSQQVRDSVVATVLGGPFLVVALVDPGGIGAEARVLTLCIASLAPAAAFAGIAGKARDEARVSGAVRQVIAGTLIEHTARGERVRIAHELHDVVAHHISMVAVQAEHARLATPGMPAAGAERLSAIGDTARTALTEMRRLLGVLRPDSATDGGVTSGAPSPRPQPGLEQLNELLDQARDATGSGARLIIRGPAVGLDPGIELAAYRIIQEALTNARRHAPGAAVDVELTYSDEALQLRVRDNGPGPSPTATAGGHGLPGMRERAAAVGGRVRAGAAEVGGFVVEATLPATGTLGREELE